MENPKILFPFVVPTGVLKFGALKVFSPVNLRKYYEENKSINWKGNCDSETLVNLFDIYEIDIALKYWRKSAQSGNIVVQEWLIENGYTW